MEDGKTQGIAEPTEGSATDGCRTGTDYGGCGDKARVAYPLAPRGAGILLWRVGGVYLESQWYGRGNGDHGDAQERACPERRKPESPVVVCGGAVRAADADTERVGDDQSGGREPDKDGAGATERHDPVHGRHYPGGAQPGATLADPQTSGTVGAW